MVSEMKHLNGLYLLVLSLMLVLVLYLTRTPDWAGWLLMYLSFLIVLADGSIRQNRNLLICIWLALLVHHGAALANTYLFTLPGAEADAIWFHNRGKLFNKKEFISMHLPEGLEFAVGSTFYVKFLAFFYKFGGGSHLLGQELSVLAYLLSCLVFVRLLDLLNMNRYRIWLVLLYGLLPSGVIFGSVTLRESFEVLFFMLGVYTGLRVYMRPAKWASVMCMASFFVMGLFHQLLLFYAVFAVALVLAMPLLWIRDGTRRRLIAAGVVAAVVAIGLVTIPAVTTRPGDDYFAMIKNGVIPAILKYRKSIERMNPRTAYNVTLDGSTYEKLVTTTSVVYIHYLFAPFPWQSTDLKGVYAAFEGTLRFILLLAAGFAVFCKSGSERKALAMLLIMYISMTFLWSLGTTNYGQGIRHHMLSNWILIIVGGHGLMTLLRRALAGHGASRSQPGPT
jgi:hypothetical protein